MHRLSVHLHVLVAAITLATTGTAAESASTVTASATAATSTITKAAALPSTAPQFVDEHLFTSAVLNSTNFYRREHDAQDAVWNDTIAAFATAYLENDTDCTFAHSGGPYGENIAVGCSDVVGCVQLWGDERREYNFADPGFTEETGHFSQLVWKNSTTVGCGKRLCEPGAGMKSTGWYLVCEYWPRGNVIGQFGEEVSRQVRGATDDGELVGKRPSAGLVTAALVVLAVVISAFLGDVMSVLKDTRWP